MWGPIIAAGVSALGASMANRRSEDYAREMSGTAYQRAMQDMRKAGLNPLLAGKLGGADTPSFTAQNPFAGAANAYGEVSRSNTAKKVAESTVDYNLAAADAAKTQSVAAQRNATTNEQRFTLDRQLAELNTERERHTWLANLSEINARINNINATARQTNAQTALAALDWQAKKLGLKEQSIKSLEWGGYGKILGWITGTDPTKEAPGLGPSMLGPSSSSAQDNKRKSEALD